MERMYAEFVAGILDSVSLIEESPRYQNTLQNKRKQLDAEQQDIFVGLSA
jgi:flagellum-specific peptidoglycan hydrolase FlgJ